MSSSVRRVLPQQGLTTRTESADPLIGRWDDPNPSTQMQPLDLSIHTQDIQREQGSNDLSSAPVFNHALRRALKDADSWRYNNGQEETTEEQRAFTTVPFELPFVGVGEDVHFDISGRNLIMNGNYEEKQIRFARPLYHAALDDRYERVGSNYVTNAGRGVTSTLHDKVLPRPVNTNLDSALLVASHPGYANLRNDFIRPSPMAPGIDENEPLSIGLFNDVTLRNDEVLERVEPIDSLPPLGNKLSVAAAISRSFKR